MQKQRSAGRLSHWHKLFHDQKTEGVSTFGYNHNGSDFRWLRHPSWVLDHTRPRKTCLVLLEPDRFSFFLLSFVLLGNVKPTFPKTNSRRSTGLVDPLQGHGQHAALLFQFGKPLTLSRDDFRIGIGDKLLVAELLAPLLNILVHLANGLL